MAVMRVNAQIPMKMTQCSDYRGRSRVDELLFISLMVFVVVSLCATAFERVLA